MDRIANNRFGHYPGKVYTAVYQLVRKMFIKLSHLMMDFTNIVK